MIFKVSFSPSPSPYYIGHYQLYFFIVTASLTNACATFISDGLRSRRNKPLKNVLFPCIFTYHIPQGFSNCGTHEFFRAYIKQIIHGKIEIYFCIPYGKMTQEHWFAIKHVWAPV